MMEEGPPMIRPAVSVGPEGQQQQQVGYTIPGVLHFIKHEFTRFEKDRANWDIERAELQTKVAFLQGERKGHENLMRDLVRRIKMLEYALKQERAKLYKLQHGTDIFTDMKMPQVEENHQQVLEAPSIVNQKQSRQMLREYLREVGFPDNVLEARMARINMYKSLVASQKQPEETMTVENGRQVTIAENFPVPTQPVSPPSISVSFERPPSPVSPSVVNANIPNGTDTEEHPGASLRERSSQNAPANAMEEDEEEEEEEREKESTEALLEKEFKFLEDEDSDDEEEREDWEGKQPVDSQNLLESLEDSSISDISSLDLDRDTETAEDEFVLGNYSPESSGSDSPTGKGNTENEEDWKLTDLSSEIQKYKDYKQPRKFKAFSARPSKSELQRMQKYANQADDDAQVLPTGTNQELGIGMMRLPGRNRRIIESDPFGLGPLSPTGQRAKIADERIEVSLGLGDLAHFSISNEATLGFENPPTQNVRRWDHKYTMRSHFDVVTCVAFHPLDHVVVTGSEDCSLKLWNLQKAGQGRKSAIIDVEPVYTFRGHSGPVLSVALSTDGEVCYSSSTDSTIRMWQVPGDLVDPYDVYDSEVHRGVLEGHTDSVWDLVVHPSTGLLASSSADGSCILWDPQLSSPQVRTFGPDETLGIPTCIDFLQTELQQMAVSYNTSKAVIYDLETGKTVVNLDSATTYDGSPNTQINKIVCHPTLPIIMTAHEDKYIRFYDSNTGKVMHSMTAHMDAVTGLAVDPHGLYLLSGSHDGSLRFWSVESRICMQEITAHRKRFDEAIYNVACHLTQPYFASCGADGIAKVFV